MLRRERLSTLRHSRHHRHQIVALVDSLLSAIVRGDGDALVMHVGERPYVVVGTSTINISTHGLTLDAMTGMLSQLLTAEAHAQLEEFGAVEHRIPQPGHDQFTVVAARGGDDIWIEIRRRRPAPAVVAPPAVPVAAVPEPQPAQHEPMMAASEPATTDPIETAEPEPIVARAIAEPTPEPEPMATPLIAEPEPRMAPVAEAPVFEQPILEAAQVKATMVEPLRAVAFEPQPATEPIRATEPEPVPVLEARQQFESATLLVPEHEFEAAVDPVASSPEPILVEPVLQPAAELLPEQMPEPTLEPIAEPAAPPIAPSVPEPIIEPVLQPAAALTSAPIVEPVVEPIVEPTVEPIVAPVAEPITAPRIAYREPEPLPMVASVESEPRGNGVVLPMSRPSRVGASPRPTAAARATSIERLLRLGAARGAAALILTSDSRPWIRVEGDLRQLEGESPLSRADVEAAIFEIAPDSGHESIGRGEATEWVAEFTDVGRVRCTTFVDHRGPGVLLRMIATRTATADQLGLTREVQALATEPQGIVLIAAPRGGGKSTLISALVDVVNRHRAEFVITLERQVRLVHDNKLALISQREINVGADDSVTAARSALRENPDVFVVDDLVSPQMVPLLLTAASQGLLVFVSITASSTTDAVQRFIELAPAEARKAVQNAMAESFRGAVAQVRLKKAGGGWISAREVLLATGPVARVIGEGQLAQLPLALEGGRKYGMVSFTDALADFVRAGTVDVREAFRKSPDRTRLLDSLKRDGVDTSVVERLA